MTDGDRYRIWEVRHRRPAATHPDRCRKIRLCGVPFALPPRGMQVVPRFSGNGEVQLELAGGDAWPQVSDLLARVESSLVSSSATLTGPEAGRILGDLMALARGALRTQYDLSDAQIVELLSFDAETRPQWIDDLLRWAQVDSSGGTPPTQLKRQRWWHIGPQHRRNR